ncbi:MAG: flagellar biosynthesis protein FlhA [Nitrospirae bacterium]|nr:flagellar biosynthesis protein FlhA [Nitrospirota bacterium]
MKFLELLRKRSEVVVAVGMIGVLCVMLLPIPSFILDVFLSISIALSVVIIITAVYIRKPLDFSIFPSLLLMVTLYRLALNIAATRLILLRGSEGIESAGEVIKAFGSFVVGGNYAVGLIIFVILIIVNFVVITKGSGRIAEVAARFTLDAMPGKQMAIDADLNSGLIDEAEARRRRSSISHEADFYGAMDGASKFVRGDAIAGLLITGINIIGGLIIGILQKGMPVGEAASTYTILTIGDGLVSQVPALLVSTAAGLIVSRAGSDSDMGKDITAQLLVNPKALATASAVLFAFGLVPGLPHIPFILISMVSGGVAYAMFKTPLKEEAPVKSEALQEEPKIETFLELDPLALEIGYGLIPLVEGGLTSKIKAMRRQLASEMGFVLPSMHIKDNLQLRPNEYSLLIRGVEVARGEVMTGCWLAVAGDKVKEIAGIPTKEPAFGLPAYWIEEKDMEKAQLAGYMVVDTASVVTTHLIELMKRHAWELLTRTEVQNLLDNVSRVYPKIIEELIPTHLTLGGVQRVLQNLLKERVPVNDLVTVLETLLDYAPSVKDTEILTEYARQSLSRYIAKQYISPDGSIPVLMLDPRLERALSQVMDTGEAISPDTVGRVLKGIEGILALGKDRLKGMQPVMLCSAKTRRFLKRIIDRFMPSIAVLSNAEIPSSAKLYTVGTVRYED